MVMRLLPTFCTSILYWTVYSQMGSVFVEQGRQMDCRLGSITVPAATLTTFDTVCWARNSFPAAASPRLPLQAPG